MEWRRRVGNGLGIIGFEEEDEPHVHAGAALRYSQGVQLHTLTFKKFKGKKKFYIDILDKKKKSEHPEIKILNILK